MNSQLKVEMLNNLCFMSFDGLGNANGLRNTNGLGSANGVGNANGLSYFIDSNNLDDLSCSKSLLPHFNNINDDSESIIWMASANINEVANSKIEAQLRDTNAKHYLSQTKTNKLSFKQIQKDSVRLLLECLISQYNLTAHLPNLPNLSMYDKQSSSSSLGLEDKQLQGLSLIKNQTSLFLDESNFPYLLRPLKYKVSFSHSKEKVVCAVRKSNLVENEYNSTKRMNTQLGIDTELNLISERISNRYFTENENLWLEGIALKHRQQARNLIWMLKEACIKKVGESNDPVKLFNGLTIDVVKYAAKLNKAYEKYLDSYEIRRQKPCYVKEYSAKSNQLIYFSTASDTDLILYFPNIPLIIITSNQ